MTHPDMKQKFYIHSVSAIPPTAFIDQKPRYDGTLLRPDTIGAFSSYEAALIWADSQMWLIIDTPEG